MKRLAALGLAAVLTAGAAPEDPASYAWRLSPGATVPLDGGLTDEAGHPFQRATDRPTILDLGYFHCPSLCGTVRADLFNALASSGLANGVDYDLVALSIDPAESPADAASAKSADRAQAPFLTETGTHYLTGTPGAITAIGNAVGFRDRFDPALKQFLHPTGLVVLTRTGIVSSYLLGVGYNSGDVRAAVLRAGEGGIAQAALPVLLLCFHFDSTTGRYTLAIEKVLRLMAGLTVVTLAAGLVLLHRGRPRPSA